MKYIRLYKPNNPGDSRLYTNFKNHKVYTDNMYKYGVFEGSKQYFEIPNMLVGYGNPKIVKGKHKLEGQVSTITEQSLTYDSLLHFQVPENKVFKSLAISIGNQVSTRILLESKLLMFIVDPSAELDPNTDNLIYHAPLTREHISEFEGTGLAPIIISTTGEVSSDGYITFPLDRLKAKDEIYIALELPYTYDVYKAMFGNTSGSTAIRLVFRDESDSAIFVDDAFGNTSNLFYFNPSKVTDDAFRIFRDMDGSQTTIGSRLGIKTKQDLATLKYDITSDRICESGSFTQRHLSDYNYYNEHRNYVAFKNVGDTSGEIFMSDNANGVVEWCKSKFSSITPQLLNTPDLDNDKWKTFETKPTLAPGEAIVIRSCRSCGTTFKPKFNIILEASGDIRTVLNYISLPTAMDCSISFRDCASLITTPDFSKITSVRNYSLGYAFQNCTSLTTPPDFSNVKKIEDNGCRGLFQGCTSLTTAPDFSNVKDVGVNGFMFCFWGCTSLTTPPNFSKITRARNSVFNYCFKGCTSLTTPPDFSKITSITNYGNTFKGCFSECTSLNLVVTPNINTWIEDDFDYWLDRVAPSGVVRKPAALIIPTGVSGIPTGWTTENY